MDIDWKDGEFAYCAKLWFFGGDEKVGHKPESIKSYLRLQSADARRNGEMVIARVLNLLAKHVEEKI